MSNGIKVNDYCTVYGKPGQVRYITEDGWYGVALLNEHGRIDEWQASQVVQVSASEGGRLAAKWMQENK